ncbi:hypothetical protein MYIN104542_26550 [Mycobacterium intermedium]
MSLAVTNPRKWAAAAEKLEHYPAVSVRAKAKHDIFVATPVARGGSSATAKAAHAIAAQ